MDISERRRAASENPAKFRNLLAKEILWFNEGKEETDSSGNNSRWFYGGETNLVLNSIEKYASGINKNKAAVIWENENRETRVYTYQMLSDHVNRFANALVSLNVSKGDVVSVYLGNIPELVIVMLACSAIGAIHNVIYNGYQSESLKFRINDPATKVIVTSDSLQRMGTYLPLKENIDSVSESCPTVEKIVVVKSGNPNAKLLNSDKEIWYDELMIKQENRNRNSALKGSHTAFITYVSVADKEPKRIEHLLGPYLVSLKASTGLLFDPSEQDILFADYEPGNIRHISYGIYGPLLHGMTIFMYDGLPNSPSPERYWEMIQNNHITIFLTTPTQLRALKQLGDDQIKKYNFASLRLTGISGEPVYRDTVSWYKKNIGRNNAGLLNFWMQSETGTALLASYSEYSAKELSCLTPLPGISAKVINPGNDTSGQESPGFLHISSKINSLKSLSSRAEETKLIREDEKSSDWMFTGDGAIKSGEDCFEVLGRTDDVIKVASHRFSRKELESVVKLHNDIKEAVVVRRPDNLKGTAIVVFVQLNEGKLESVLLKEEIKNFVASNICRIAKPDELIFLDQFPLTSEGSINRKQLRTRALESAENIKPEILKRFNILERLRGEE